MLWLRTQKGFLYNLEKVSMVFYSEQLNLMGDLSSSYSFFKEKDDFGVYVEMNTGKIEFVGAYRTKARAQVVVDEIQEHIESAYISRKLQEEIYDSIPNDDDETHDSDYFEKKLKQFSCVLEVPKE